MTLEFVILDVITATFIADRVFTIDHRWYRISCGAIAGTVRPRQPVDGTRAARPACLRKRSAGKTGT